MRCYKLSSKYLIYTDGKKQKAGYNIETDYIATTALSDFKTYYNTLNEFTNIDFSSTNGVEFRLVGYKQRNNGTCIGITRGHIIGLRFDNSGNLTKQVNIIDFSS